MTTPKNDPYWQGPDERAGVPTEHDPVNRPSHYMLPSGIQVMQAIEHLPFCRGAAVKYIIRAGNKAGADEVEDLKKARWNIDNEIERIGRALRAAPCEVGPTLDASGSVMASGSRTYNRPLGSHVATFTEDDGSTTEVDFSTRTVTKIPAKKAAKKGRAR